MKTVIIWLQSTTKTPTAKQLMSENPQLNSSHEEREKTRKKKKFIRI